MLFNSLSEGEPKSARDIVSSVGIDGKKVSDGLYYWWKKGALLRSEHPIHENIEVFKGQRGFRRNTRAYYLCSLRHDGKDSVHFKGQRFVPFEEKYLDVRGSKKIKMSGQHWNQRNRRSNIRSQQD